MYSILFSAVTGMFAPPGFNSSIYNKKLPYFRKANYFFKHKHYSLRYASPTNQTILYAIGLLMLETSDKLSTQFSRLFLSKLTMNPFAGQFVEHSGALYFCCIRPSLSTRNIGISINTDNLIY